MGNVISYENQKNEYGMSKLGGRYSRPRLAS